MNEIKEVKEKEEVKELARLFLEGKLTAEEVFNLLRR